jgi:hypothetical protein
MFLVISLVLEHHIVVKELTLRERERAWNKPVPKSPGQNGTPEAQRYSSGAFENGYIRSRRSSSASLNGFETSSAGSRADCRYQLWFTMSILFSSSFF